MLLTIPWLSFLQAAALPRSANPIGEVLTKLGTALGRTFSFGLVVAAVAALLQLLPTAAVTIMDASRSLREFEALCHNFHNKQQIARRQCSRYHRANLMFQPGVMGVGVGAIGPRGWRSSHRDLCE